MAMVAAFCAAAAALSAQPGQTHRFGLDDFSRVARVADPQIAPDARSIAVVISRPNLDEDRFDPELVVVDVATSAQRRLVTGLAGISSPRWSSDGDRIAFLANAGAGPAAHLQVYVVSARGGQPKVLTAAPRAVQQIAWSPDSRTLSYATQDEPAKPAGFERFNDSFEVTLNTDMTTTAAVPPTHLWTVPASGGASKRLTSGPWSLPLAHPPGPPASAIAWTLDGAAIAFSRTGGGGGQRGGTAAGGIQLVNVNDLTIKPLANVSGTFPQFSAATGAVVFMGGGGVSAVTAPGGPARNLTQALDRSMARALWMPDGKSVLVGANDSVRVSLWLQPLAGPARKLDVGDVSPNSSFFVDMNVGKDGSIAFAGSSPMRPAELYYMASASAPVKRLTDVNADLAALPLGRTDVITWKNDNFQENGLLTYPPDFDPSRKYPLVLLIHGGPRAASLLNFSPGAQLMAAKGWLVFQPNYRGSDNLGSAYQRAIGSDAGEGPGRDVMSGIEAVKSRGIVDESRMAVSGWSYGGYMTTWMLGHYDIWKAAVAGAPVTNQLDQYNLSDGAGGGRGNSSPWVNPQVMERMRAQSPITYAAKIKAPTLILHDVGDYRVAITQSYELFHALKDNGVTTQFFAYPISGHNPADPVLQRDVQRRWIGWLEQYLTPAPAVKSRGR
jgi:dipeptidyl aminopeptidase/acylaminoacyl peptidase